jgi:hypothetical protein
VHYVEPTADSQCSQLFPGRAYVRVGFHPLPSCYQEYPVDERPLRYLVYYGTEQGGPYENTDLDRSDPAVPNTIIIRADRPLEDPFVEVIDDMFSDTRLYFAVIAEDEARNVYPPDFDPLVHSPASLPNETSVRTPVCEAQRCIYRAPAPGRDTSQLFVIPRDPMTDVAFADPSHQQVYGPCPFQSGDTDPEQVLAPGAPELIFYQAWGADLRDFRVTADRDWQTVRLWF